MVISEMIAHRLRMSIYISFKYSIYGKSASYTGLMILQILGHYLTAARGVSGLQPGCVCCCCTILLA